MLLLQFQIADDFYGFDVHSVLEVLPLVKLKLVDLPTGIIAGLLNYRGKFITAINLSMLIKNKELRKLISTRIIVVKFNYENHSELRLALLAEKVTDTIAYQQEDLQKQNAALGRAEYISSCLKKDEKTVYIIDINKLISKEIQDQIFTMQKN